MSNIVIKRAAAQQRLWQAGSDDPGQVKNPNREGSPPLIGPATASSERPIEALSDRELTYSEVLTMGVQQMWEDPAEFRGSDPEYFRFI